MCLHVKNKVPIIWMHKSQDAKAQTQTGRQNEPHWQCLAEDHLTHAQYTQVPQMVVAGIILAAHLSKVTDLCMPPVNVSSGPVADDDLGPIEQVEVVQQEGQCEGQQRGS